MELDHITATNEDVVQWCEAFKNRKDIIIGGHHGGNLVLKMNALAVVKFGIGLSFVEARNQIFACEYIQSNLLRVPTVYRYFQDSSQSNIYARHRYGYLVMEYVSGVPLSSFPASDLPFLTSLVKGAILHMSTLTSLKPGPPHGGEAEGCIWGDYGSREDFQTVEDIEVWFNRALSLHSTSIQLGQYALQFCHLDLARRNILFLSNGGMCILDWASAGFYPWLFELWAMSWPNEDRSYFDALLEIIGPVTAKDQRTLDKLWEAYRINAGQCVSNHAKVAEETAILWNTNEIPRDCSRSPSLHPSLFDLEQDNP